MTRYLWILALPGGAAILALIALGLFVQRRRQQSIDADLMELKPPIQKFGKLSPAESEAMRIIAERRRDHANGKRLEAAQIESGASSPERMRLVRR